jgi:MarR family transcriptional regulator, transcriptional regulator for hemolysin
MSSVNAPESTPDLAFLLSQASYVLTTELSAGLAKLGISPRAFCVLSRAQQAELTQIQLAEQCNLDKTTMVMTIDELERAGLAKRQPSPADRRAHLITVTHDGQQVVAEGERIVAGIHHRVLSALPERDREPFVESLVQLVRGPLATPAPCERPVRRRRSA